MTRRENGRRDRKEKGGKGKEILHTPMNPHSTFLTEWVATEITKDERRIRVIGTVNSLKGEKREEGMSK